MKRFSLLLTSAAALCLAACNSGSRQEWEKADSDEQQLRSALYWCAQQQTDNSFIKFGTSEQKERGDNRKTAVDEECMRNKGWTTVAK